MSGETGLKVRCRYWNYKIVEVGGRVHCRGRDGRGKICSHGGGGSHP